MILEPVNVDVVDTRWPRLVSAGVDVHAIRVALEGPGTVGPAAAARVDELGRHLDGIEAAIGERPAYPFRPALAELSARLVGMASTSAVDAEGLAHVLRAVERVAADLDAYARHAAALEALGATLDADAAKLAAELGRYVGAGPARVLAAHDLPAARLAALALGPEGLQGDARTELLDGLDVSADLAAALGAGDAPARLGPGQVRAVERARERLVSQRVARRLEDEHAAKVAALVLEERASLDAAIAAEPPAPKAARRRAAA